MHNMKFAGLTLSIWCSFCAATAIAQADGSGAHFNRGVVLQQKGDLEGARQAYEQALRLAPRRVDARSNLGLVYLNLGRNEQAVEALSRALAIQPELAAARLFLGLAQFRAGRIEAAQRELTRVLDAQPAHPQALHLLGLCLLKRDRVEEGIRALEAALQANAVNADAAYTLATAYLAVGEIEKAEALLEGPLRQKTGAETHLIRGAILNARRDAKAALEELTRAKQLNETLPTLRTQMGYAYLLLAESEKAAGELLAALTQTPDDFHANAYLGWLYIQQKRYAEAAERLTAGLRQKPDNATLLYQLGQLEFLGGRMENAARKLERAVQLRADFLPAHVLLTRVYSKLKRTEDFRQAQQRVRLLTEQEQEKNLAAPDRAVEQENTLRRFAEGLSGKPQK
jgi:protein O-GlcNAc transferase